MKSVLIESVDYFGHKIVEHDKAEQRDAKVPCSKQTVHYWAVKWTESCHDFLAKIDKEHQVEGNYLKIYSINWPLCLGNLYRDWFPTKQHKLIDFVHVAVCK